MRKNKFYIFASLLIGSFLLSSCLKDDEYTPIPVAGLTMVNGYVGDNGIIYYVGQRAVEPLAYKTYTHANVLEGNRSLIIRGLNSPELLIDTTVSIEDSTYYSSFAFGTNDNPKHFIVKDKVIETELANDKVGVRFFNASEVDGQVSLQIGDQALEPTFQNRAVDNQTSATEHQDFLAHGSGTFTLTIKDGSGAVLATREAVKLDASGYYSIVLLGNPADDSKPLYIGVIGQAVN